MTRGPIQIDQSHVTYDGKVWAIFAPAAGFDAAAAELAEKYADTREGRALLTRSLVALNHDALSEKGGVTRVYSWVPDRGTGQVMAFMNTGIRVFPNAESATPERFAALDAQKDVGRKFKVLDHATKIFDCKAGRGMLAVYKERERGSTKVTLLVAGLIFPPVPGIREALLYRFFTDHLDLDLDVAGWARMFVENTDLTVRLADGTLQHFPSQTPNTPPAPDSGQR